MSGVKNDNFIKLADNVFMSGICNGQKPCHHLMKIDGRAEYWSCVDLANLFEKRGIIIPEHFSKQLE